MEFLVRNRRICGSGGFFFFPLTGALSVVLTIDSSHSQHLSFEYTDYTPISQPLSYCSAEKPVPRTTYLEGAPALPDQT